MQPAFLRKSDTNFPLQLWLDFDILSSAQHPKVHKAITMMGVIGFWHPVKCMTTSSSAQSHLHDECDWILTSCQVQWQHAQVHSHLHDECGWILTSCHVHIPMMFVTGFWHPVKCINLPRAGMGKNMKYIYQKTSQTGQEKTMWKCFYAVNIKILFKCDCKCNMHMTWNNDWMRDKHSVNLWKAQLTKFLNC